MDPIKYIYATPHKRSPSRGSSGDSFCKHKNQIRATRKGYHIGLRAKMLQTDTANKATASHTYQQPK